MHKNSLLLLYDNSPYSCSYAIMMTSADERCRFAGAEQTSPVHENRNRVSQGA